MLNALNQAIANKYELENYHPHEDLNQYIEERKAATESGVPALLRLIDLADLETEQSVIVRKFLLGIYSGNHFPFNLTSLKVLDTLVIHDCSSVLLFGSLCHIEFMSNMDKDFQRLKRWAKMAGGAQ